MREDQVTKCKKPVGQVERSRLGKIATLHHLILEIGYLSIFFKGSAKVGVGKLFLSHISNQAHNHEHTDHLESKILGLVFLLQHSDKKENKKK